MDGLDSIHNVQYFCARHNDSIVKSQHKTCAYRSRCTRFGAYCCKNFKDWTGSLDESACHSERFPPRSSLFGNAKRTVIRDRAIRM